MENLPVATNQDATMAMPATPIGTMSANAARQPVMKQIGFLLAIAASIALGGYVFMWSQTPNYQVLFSGMQPKESSEVISILQQSNVQYKLDPATGAVLVPASKVQSLRLKMAAEGLPRSSSQGMEMLNEEQGFGTSQFIERARYQNALEEELARSIAQLQNIHSARVHLAIPKQSVFVRDRKPPTASVVIKLYAGRTLERSQVEAITNMVASSISNMTSKHVTIVDQKGRLWTKSDRGQGIEMSDNQLQYTQKLERTYIRRIEDILSPIVGLEGVRAQVVADVDFTVTEQTQESYNPDLAAVRSEQIQEDNRVGVIGALGVPGALSNQPPGGGIAPEVATDEEGQVVQTKPGSSSKRSTRNFELDRTISHTRLSPGAIRRLSVAVLVDEKRSVDAEGNVTKTALSEAEMTRINALVMDAIGFNKARGDSLNIVNAPFLAPEAIEPLPEPAIWQQPWVWDIAKQVLGALLVLFLIFKVIKPAFKDLNTVPVTENNQGEMQANQGQGPMTVAETSDDIAQIATGSGEMEAQMANVRSLVQQDPALVAQVVKNWTAA